MWSQSAPSLGLFFSPFQEDGSVWALMARVFWCLIQDLDMMTLPTCAACYIMHALAQRKTLLPVYRANWLPSEVQRTLLAMIRKITQNLSMFCILYPVVVIFMQRQYRTLMSRVRVSVVVV